VRTEEAFPIFSTSSFREADWHGKPFPAGLFRSRSTFRDLLNDGTHPANWRYARTRGIWSYMEDILVFDVLDPSKNGRLVRKMDRRRALRHSNADRLIEEPRSSPRADLSLPKITVVTPSLIRAASSRTRFSLYRPAISQSRVHHPGRRQHRRQRRGSSGNTSTISPTGSVNKMAARPRPSIQDSRARPATSCAGSTLTICTCPALFCTLQPARSGKSELLFGKLPPFHPGTARSHTAAMCATAMRRQIDATELHHPAEHLLDRKAWQQTGILDDRSISASDWECFSCAPENRESRFCRKTDISPSTEFTGSQDGTGGERGGKTASFTAVTPVPATNSFRTLLCIEITGRLSKWIHWRG